MKCKDCKKQETHNSSRICSWCIGRRKRKLIRQPQRPIPQDLKICNCAECSAVVLGDSKADWYDGLSPEEQAKLPSPVRGRINGRPYCGGCLELKWARANS